MYRVKFTDEVYIKIRLKLQLLLIMYEYFCGKCNMFYYIMNDVHIRYCYLPLSWKSWNWFECAVGGVLICFCFDVVADVSIVSMAS